MPISNTPSMLELYTEFGAPVGTPLTDFVRGGPWVPNVAQNNNVPTAPPISLLQLVGAVKTTPLIVSHSPAANGRQFRNEPAPATVNVGVSTTISVSGGIGPYNYAWSFVSGDNTMAATMNGVNGNWQKVLNRNTSASATYRCTVTDQSGQTVQHNVSVSLAYDTDL